MYTEKVLDHFSHPRNMGELQDANGVGMVGNAKCGDIMQMFLKIDDDGIIEDVGFKTFGCGAAIGVPLFFLTKAHTGVSTAAICMILVMLPFFLLAMYERNGQPLEKILRNIIRVCFLRPKQRPYETNNFYAVLERQDRLDKEVYQIVNHKKPDKSRTQKD